MVRVKLLKMKAQLRSRPSVVHCQFLIQIALMRNISVQRTIRTQTFVRSIKNGNDLLFFLRYLNWRSL